MTSMIESFMASTAIDGVTWGHIVRICMAALLGALLGVERELNGRPAGLRTGMMVAMGACLFTILSVEGFAAAAGIQDPTRIASQIVIGVGFLGSGALIRGEKEIHGLTTAADIWLGAGIGMAVGAGMEVLAAFVAILAVCMLTVLRPISKRLARVGERRTKQRAAVRKP
jgi:putative Mg2+ transporter-C (MgtC) family protein